MGRTNPTFRDRLRRTREDWQAYRRALRARHKPAFDALFADAESYADAAGHQNAREPMHPILVSMLLAQKRELRDLRDRVERLEAQVDAADDGGADAV